MNWFTELLCDIGRDPKPFLAGVLSGFIGLVLGFALLKFF